MRRSQRRGTSFASPSGSSRWATSSPTSSPPSFQPQPGRPSSLPLREPIDLLHAGVAHAIGSYLVDTSEGLSLFDCGPTSCLPAFKAGLAACGLELGEIRHLLLSHIHLDHAGAAG